MSGTQMNDEELRAEILDEFKTVYRLAPSDYTENCTNIVMSLVNNWHTRKLNEAVLAELNRLYVEHNRHFGTDTCELIKERITEIKLESIYERRHS